MDEMTHTELENFILNNIKGACFVSARSKTVQSLLKKGKAVTSAMIESTGINPNKIIKHADTVFLISGGTVSYEDFVKNRLIKELPEGVSKDSVVPFEAKEHRWGKLKHDGCNAILTHKDPAKGGRYLIAYRVAKNKPKVGYFHEGVEVDVKESRFDAYRNAPRKEGERQKTKKPIIIRDFDFKNIKEITLFKKTYKVVPDKD